MEDLARIIGTIGIPGAIAFFVLTRLEKNMERIIHLIEGVGGCIDKLNEILEYHQRRKK